MTIFTYRFQSCSLIDAILQDSSSSGQTEKRLDSESKDAVNAINKSISSKKQEVRLHRISPLEIHQNFQ